MPSGRGLCLTGESCACDLLSTVCEEVDRISNGKNGFHFLAKTIRLARFGRRQSEGRRSSQRQDFVLERVNLRLAQ